MDAYLEAHRHDTRRAEVRRMLDAGYELPAIVQAFRHDARLAALIADLEIPLTTLRRDLAYWRAKDKDTPIPILSLERQARFIQAEINNPAVTVAARLSLIRELGKVEDSLAKLRGQVRHVPGFGRELAEEEDEEADPWAAQDAIHASYEDLEDGDA